MSFASVENRDHQSSSSPSASANPTSTFGALLKEKTNFSTETSLCVEPRTSSSPLTPFSQVGASSCPLALLLLRSQRTLKGHVDSLLRNERDARCGVLSIQQERENAERCQLESSSARPPLRLRPLMTNDEPRVLSRVL